MAGREMEPLTPADLEVLAPYLDLARELKAEIDRITADPDADLGEVSRAIDDLPRQARAEMVGRVFAALTPEAQWSVLERVFGDAELRDHLEAEREARLAAARRAGAVAPALVQARAERRLDLSGLPEGHEVVVGLFRPVDVRAALALGSASSTCARALTVHTTSEPGGVLDGLAAMLMRNLAGADGHGNGLVDGNGNGAGDRVEAEGPEAVEVTVAAGAGDAALPPPPPPPEQPPT